MEMYKDIDTPQAERVLDGADRLEDGKTLMRRTGGVLVTARKRDRGDFIVARSKNATTKTDVFEDAHTAANKFDRHAFETNG